MAALERQHFWGCTLTKEKPEEKWLGTNAADIGEVDVLNQLVLSQACLGSKAKDSVSHVVQVTTTGMNSNTITQPIVVLGSGIRQAQCRLEFSAAATFKLIDGQGPVHLSGSHVQVLSGGDDYEDSEGESEDEGIASGKQSPVKGKTQPSPSPSKQPPAKRAKLEPEKDASEEEGSSDEDDDDDEPDELIPMKDDKAKKKPVVETKKLPQKAEPPDKKAKLNLLDKEAEEGSEESEDEMEESDDDDDENDEDFDGDSDEEEGDEDDDDNDDDSDEEESEEEDEIANAILAKNKLRGQVNGKQTPDKKMPDKKTPQKKTPDTKTPKKTSVEASVNLEKTPDIATVKQKLLKSPNLPKKMDKFRNFMKTNMRITEEKVLKELWTWLQQNKK